jgi:hypothetical protein
MNIAEAQANYNAALQAFNSASGEDYGPAYANYSAAKNALDAAKNAPAPAPAPVAPAPAPAPRETPTPTAFVDDGPYRDSVDPERFTDFTPEPVTPPVAPASAAPTSPWEIDAKQFNDAIAGKLQYNNVPAGSVSLTLANGRVWTPSGAGGGITYHPADPGGWIASEGAEGGTTYAYKAPIPVAYYEVSGDLSAMLGTPGSDKHANVKYIEQNGKMVPLGEPKYWNWEPDTAFQKALLVFGAAVLGAGVIAELVSTAGAASTATALEGLGVADLAGGLSSTVLSSAGSELVAAGALVGGEAAAATTLAGELATSAAAGTGSSFTISGVLTSPGATIGNALGITNPTLAQMVGNTIIETAKNGGDVGKAIQNAAISTGLSLVGSSISSDVTKALKDIPTDVLPNIVKSGIAQGVSGAVTATVTGGSPLSALAGAAIGTAVNGVIGEIPELSNLPKEAQSVARAAITASLTGKDITDAALVAALAEGKKAITGYVGTATGLVPDLKAIEEEDPALDMGQPGTSILDVETSSPAAPPAPEDTAPAATLDDIESTLADNGLQNTGDTTDETIANLTEAGLTETTPVVDSPIAGDAAETEKEAARLEAERLEAERVTGVTAADDSADRLSDDSTIATTPATAIIVAIDPDTNTALTDAGNLVDVDDTAEVGDVVITDTVTGVTGEDVVTGVTDTDSIDIPSYTGDTGILTRPDDDYYAPPEDTYVPPVDYGNTTLDDIEATLTENAELGNNTPYADIPDYIGGSLPTEEIYTRPDDDYYTGVPDMLLESGMLGSDKADNSGVLSDLPLTDVNSWGDVADVNTDFDPIDIPDYIGGPDPDPIDIPDYIGGTNDDEEPEPEPEGCGEGFHEDPVTGLCVPDDDEEPEPEPEGCAEGFHEDPVTGLCVPDEDKAEEECPEGQVRNLTTGLCEIGGTRPIVIKPVAPKPVAPTPVVQPNTKTKQADQLRGQMQFGLQGLMSGLQQQATQMAAPVPVETVKATPGFSLDTPLNVKAFGDYEAQKVFPKDKESLKIATGGYLDDLLEAIR